MADPATYRPAPGEIPTGPGVYRFRDPHGRVIYVGKAKSLRSRLGSYFADLSTLHPRTANMVTDAASVEWTVVGTEVEALVLEATWIKEFAPRYNVRLRDDKSYPFLAVTMSEEFPRAQVMRGAKRPGTRYFGPYPHAWAIRETLDLLLRVFPVRTCSAGVFRRAQQQGRPCLLGYIDKCAAPCVGRIDADEHRSLARDLCAFLGGDGARFTRRLEAEMAEASQELEFERAARLRDDLAALARVTERNALVLPDGTDADVFAIAGDDLEAAVQVFHVRGGRVRGQRGWVVEKVEPIDDAGLVEQVLQQVYGEVVSTISTSRSDDVPREVLVPVLPPDHAQVAAWLAGLRGASVQVRVPKRGDKRELAETVRRNAEHALMLHRTRRAGDLTTRSLALREIQEALDLQSAPLRIECYDISHTQTTYRSASMVVFEDGLPRKSEYRTFKIKGPSGDSAIDERGGVDDGNRDDSAAMYEVITRRFKRYLMDQEKSGEFMLGPKEVEQVPEPVEGVEISGSREPSEVSTCSTSFVDPPGDAEVDGAEPKRFAYPPNLVIVDGGIPQVNAARRALDDLGITDVALVGLAKRLEEIYLPGNPEPLVLDRASEGLYLMQRLRDEAHRFALSQHRKRRSKGMTTSVLDGVPGLGPIRAKELLKHFGSVKRLRAASVEEIETVRGMGPATAAAVHAALHPPTNQPANPPTSDAPLAESSP